MVDGHESNERFLHPSYILSAKSILGFIICPRGNPINQLLSQNQPCPSTVIAADGAHGRTSNTEAALIKPEIGHRRLIGLRFIASAGGILFSYCRKMRGELERNC